ncbi:hypothetical protein ACFOY4_10080 [Actinomadura syzygii]|uniref:ABC transporter permease n=1 Tax=Actinomadura syzygii TaxID=1427538 RepID=A0A5D0UBT0_9ACTN|nr:hypothetical protein [Actinomadura syzygii]TYC15838.1 hypothetical protein FXF65_10880 [Actinomadura syzygii]
MLRVELTTQLLRIRTLIALACLAAVPALAAFATASHAGHRNGDQGGLFGAATYSALNHTMASLQFILMGGLLSGLALFGWHPFRIIGAADLTGGAAADRVLAATGYTLLCMLGIAAIAFLLALLLPQGAEALAATVAFVVAASVLNGQAHLHDVAVILPVHYWQTWTDLFTPAGTAHLSTGIVAQTATIALATGIAILVLRRRDPAA